MVLSSLISALAARIAAYRSYRTTFKALSALDDRELADLGLFRGGIETVARGLAR